MIGIQLKMVWAGATVITLSRQQLLAVALHVPNASIVNAVRKTIWDLFVQR